MSCKILIAASVSNYNNEVDFLLSPVMAEKVSKAIDIASSCEAAKIDAKFHVGGCSLYEADFQSDSIKAEFNSQAKLNGLDTDFDKVDRVFVSVNTETRTYSSEGYKHFSVTVVFESLEDPDDEEATNYKNVLTIEYKDATFHQAGSIKAAKNTAEIPIYY